MIIKQHYLNQSNTTKNWVNTEHRLKHF